MDPFHPKLASSLLPTMTFPIFMPRRLSDPVRRPRFPAAMLLSLALLMGSGLPALSAGDVNLTEGARVTSSSAMPTNKAEFVVDGVVSDESRWLAASGDAAPWVELTFSKPVNIGSVDVYSGWKDEGGLEGFDLSVVVDGKRVSPDQGQVRNNRDLAKRVETNLRNVSSLRLTLPKSGPARIREIAVYEAKHAMVGAGLKGKVLTRQMVDRSVHQVAVNQVGYETRRPKRFTAPLSPDGARFSIHEAGGTTVLHEGEIRDGVGDFSAFRPKDASKRYIIEVQGGSLNNGRSDPFLIADNLYQEQFWQSAVDFLIDSRSVVATHPSAYGGCPWRDGTYYDAIIPSLVMFYLSDRGKVDAMPRQIDWAAEKARVTDAGFKFDAKNPCSEGVMEAVRNYYQLEPPKPDAPDVVKMIHWGAGYYLVNPATQDPSGDPDKRRIHSQTVEQVAYVLWAWPALKQWLPESFHEKCREFCFANWAPSLEVDRWWEPKTYLTLEQISEKNPMGGLLHPYKGRHAPGHSIVPNLLMHEVAKREGRSDSRVYLDAAVKQAAWCVANLDWNDPRTTKGQRMSEHRTIPNLVWMLQRYPKESPPGLKEKITEWGKVAVSRSSNYWDFRRYDLGTEWTIPKVNDVGNSISLPAIALSASWVVEDSGLKKGLERIAFGSIDHVFGRNPCQAAAPCHPEMGFPEVERGWPKSHPDNICARLELCRGSLSSLSGTEMYPFNPEGTFRHAEGWVNYGACWCISLAYLRFDLNSGTIPEP
jgi:hypothetical protein